MTDVDLSRPRTVHLVGIGGAGISAIGIILAAMGHRVSGADVTETPAWPALIAAGIELEVVPPADLFASAARHDAEIIAHSTAFAPTTADRATPAQVVDRAGILAAICAARPTVAVSGTHGKTSTTAMLATLLEGVGADPAFLIGAVSDDLGVAARWGGPDAPFVVEADESDGSFLELPAQVAVVTNIDEDHLDHWGSIEAIEAGFDRFVAAAPTCVVCIDDPRARRVAAAHEAVTVGESADARFVVHDVSVQRLTTSFGLTVDGREVGPVAIGTPGRHHARNAAVAIAVAVDLGIDVHEAVRAVGAYRGVARRFAVIGEADGITVVDDYAHNPGKVQALLSSAKEAGWDRVVVIFQPHRYSRTRDQGIDFGSALAHADVIAVTEVYGAGEAPIPGVSGRTVLDAVLDVRPDAQVAWVPTLDAAAAWAKVALRPGDLCLTVGAGDIASLGARLLS